MKKSERHKLIFNRFYSRLSPLRNVPLAVILPLLLLASQCGLAQSPSTQTFLPRKEDVLKAIGKRQLASDPSLNFQIKPWKSLPDSFVALLYITAANEDGEEAVRTARLHPTLVLLNTTEGRLTALAESEVGLKLSDPDGIEEEVCRELPPGKKQFKDSVLTDGNQCMEIHLDLAPYKITSTETAIGVRTKVHEVYPAGEGDSEYLTLFDIAGHNLRKIFSESMSSDDEERGPNEFLHSKSILQVSTQLTADHFDLLLIENNRVDELVETRKAHHPAPKQTTHRFTWKASAYVETK
jgi:hypothetical protein